MALPSSLMRLTAGYLRQALLTHNSLGAHIPNRGNHQQSSPPRQFKVTLDGETLYIDKELAETLGWNENTPTEGVSLRLSGWSPHYFAITQRGTDADFLAHGTVESSRNATVVATLKYLKKTDSE